MFENLKVQKKVRLARGEERVTPHTSAYNSYIIAVAALASFTFGYTNNVIAGTLAQTTFALKFYQPVANTETIISGILGGFFAGALVGAILQAPISSRWGRRAATAFAAVVMIVTSALCAGSVHIAMFITARSLNGIAAGILISNTPVYMSEVSPPHTRGLLTGAAGVAINLAYVVSSVLALAFHFVEESYQWRLQFVVCTAIGVALLVSVLLLPESPRWLIERGRTDEAWTVIRKLHKSSEDSEELLAMAEMAQIQAQIEAQKHLPKGMWFIVSHKSTRKRAICGVMTWFMGQSTGVLVIANLAPLLFGNLGYGVTVQLGLAVLWVGMGQLGTFVNVFFNDRIGRVKLMVLGGYLICIILLIEAILQKEYLNSTNKAGVKATAAMYFIFIFIFGATIEATAYTYVVEIWPTYLRSDGATLGFVSYFATTIAYNSPAPVALKNIGWRYYLILMALTIVSTTFMMFYFPETAGRTLEEVDVLFGDKLELSFDEILNSEFEKAPDAVKTSEM